MKDIVKDLCARHEAVNGNDFRIAEPVGPTIFFEAAQEIERLRAERDEERRKLRKAEIECSMLRVECGVIAAIRDDARRERDSIRRTFCFIIASGNFNARDGNTAYRCGAEHVAELNNWDCFKESA